MNREKYVDENWKESVELEKEKLDGLTTKSSPPSAAPQAQEPASHEHSSEAQSTEPEQPSPKMNPVDEVFVNYLSSLAYQAMIFLGEMPNPMTNLVEQNLEQAKFIIDTLVMLRHKTKGNLSKQEIEILNTSLYELQMRFVEISQQGGMQGMPGTQGAPHD